MMKRFVLWTGGSYVNASCIDCDFRMEFDALVKLEVVVKACDSHDCFRDGQE